MDFETLQGVYTYKKGDTKSGTRPIWATDCIDEVTEQFIVDKLRWLIAKSHVYCKRTTTTFLSESKDADNKTMVHIVFDLSYIYFNSDKVRDKKSGKVCFSVELIRKITILVDNTFVCFNDIGGMNAPFPYH